MSRVTNYNFTLEEFKDFWELEPIVVFDTNAILHLYKLSSTTSEDILTTLNLIPKNQLWLPNQVLIEYNRNMEDSRSSEFNKYRGVVNYIKGIINSNKDNINEKFEYYASLEFPKIEELRYEVFKYLSQIERCAVQYEKDVNDEIESNREMLNKNKVDTFVQELKKYNGIGGKYTVSQLLQIYREGEERYKYSIPPGYCDSGKKDPTNTDKFGDLIIWKQIMDKAKMDKKSVIFVTNDTKKDWWKTKEVKNKDVRVKPRDELYEEFEMMTSQKIEIMDLNNFYTVFARHNNVLNNRTAIEMNVEEICQDILENFDWSTIIDKDGVLTASLIHDGVLQGYLANILSDVDIYDHGTPSIETADISIDEEDNVHIEAIFTNTLSATISEAFSSEYVEDENYDIKINGVILFVFKINDEDNTLIKADSEEITIKEFSITDVEQDIHICCSICNMKKPDYYTTDGDGICVRCSSNFDRCPDCGYLFEQGTLHGGYCSECEKNS